MPYKDPTKNDTAKRAYAEKNRDAINTRRRASRKTFGRVPENPITGRARAGRWYARQENKDKVRKRRGLPAPTRPETAVCECCGKKLRRSLHLDHCHETGHFRGWLCGRCNTGIGALGDNVAGLQRAIRYLQSAEAYALLSMSDVPLNTIDLGD